MDFLTSLVAFPLTYLLPFLVVLTLVVFVHEMGHFLVGRWCGVGVHAFSIGFGPELLGYTDKSGIRWKLCAIPLGGYVKFYGDENAASVPDQNALNAMSAEERDLSLAGQSLGKRAAVVAAGPIANFLLTIGIFFFMFLVYGQQVAAPIIDEVQPDGPAAQAGFLPGDEVLTVDDQSVMSFNDIQRIISIAYDREVAVQVRREGVAVDLVVIPERREMTDWLGQTQRIGVIGIVRTNTPDDYVTISYSVPGALWKSVEETWFIIDRTLHFLGGLIIGQESVNQLGGPIKIAEVSGKVAEIGVVPLINLVALLSVSIGFLNLMPVPVLDGGHLLFYAIEAVRGKPLSAKTQDIGFRIGFGLVLCLMVFVTFNDVINMLYG